MASCGATGPRRSRDTHCQWTVALTPLAPGSLEAALNRRHAVKACAAGYRDASDKYADLAKVSYAPSELIEHH